MPAFAVHFERFVEVHLGGGWLTWNSDLTPDQSDVSHVLHGIDLTSLAEDLP